MAYIEKRKKGYLSRIVLGYDGNGKRIVKNETYHPKAKSESAQLKEVQKYAEEQESIIKAEELYNTEGITLDEFFTQWRSDIAPITLTLSKQEYYESIMKQRFLPEIGYKPIDKIRARDIQRTVTKMRNEGLKPESIRTYLSVLSSVFGKAVMMEIIPKNPVKGVIRPTNPKDEEIHTFTIPQAKAFLAALDNEYIQEHKTHTRVLKSTGKEYTVPTYEQTEKIGSMWKAYFYLALFTGARRGELVSLSWSDVDMVHNRISITKGTAKTKSQGQVIKSPKTKAGIRNVYVPQVVIDRLLTWKQEQHDYARSVGEEWSNKEGYIFTQWNGKQIDVTTPTRKFKTILNMYNKYVSDQDRLPDIHLHDLRHCTASILVAGGADIASVSRMLGHSEISMTLDRYTHVLNRENSKIAETLASILVDDTNTTARA